MKIGIFVDGNAEANAQRKILEKIRIPGVEFLGPIYVDMQPKATPRQIARKIIDKSGLTANKTEYNIILIDKEDRNDCTIAFANNIESALNSFNKQKFYVVIKQIQFENWLIASPSSFSRMKKRFAETAQLTKYVTPNLADNIQTPVSLINKIALKTYYHKRNDAVQIASLCDIKEMASNSRSFRRYLRLIGHPLYSKQSKKP
jgi:hypothetical protein